MDELVHILDALGQPTGKTCLKSQAHQYGYYHPTVHVWIYNDKNEVLLQQRSALKKTFPLFWDVSVAGHVAHNEHLLDAAVRETKEELGLTLSKKSLQKIAYIKEEHIHLNGIKDFEYHTVYLAFVRSENISIQIDNDEVAATQWIYFDDFKKLVTTTSKKMKLVPHSKEYYNTVLSYLSELS